MPGSRRDELVASAGDQALAAWLSRLQDASFSRAAAPAWTGQRTGCG